MRRTKGYVALAGSEQMSEGIQAVERRIEARIRWECQ